VQIFPDKSASVAITGSLRFEADFVVHSVAKPLLTDEVSLRRLDAHRAEQKLNFAQAPRLCHVAGAGLEQIQFLLGHVSVQTTERYLGSSKRLVNRSSKSG
jgi:integrase